MRRRQFIGLIGSAAVITIWPLAARAEQASKSYRIGYLALLPGEDTILAKVFLQRLRDFGYGGDKKWCLSIVRQKAGRIGWQNSPPNLCAPTLTSWLPDLERSQRRPPWPLPAASLSCLPGVGDPVGAGLVANLSRPSANVTGMSAQAAELSAKRLQLLNDLVPDKKPFAVLGNPDTPYTALALQEIKTAAAANEQPFAVFEARTADQLPTAIDAVVRSGAASLLVLEDPMLLGARQEFVDLVAKARLPAIYALREFADAGGLICYGAEEGAMVRRAAEYVDKILKGSVSSRPPGRTTDQVRTRHQSEDRESAGHPNSGVSAGTR